MVDTSYTTWMKAGIDTWALGLEAAAVIGMRVTKWASGGDLDGAEARLMLKEKIASAWTLPSEIVGLSPLAGTVKALDHYRGKVSANRRRLVQALMSQGHCQTNVACGAGGW